MGHSYSRLGGKDGRPDWRIGHDAFTHSQICAKIPPVELEAVTFPFVAQTLTQLTKCAEEENDPHFCMLKRERRPGGVRPGGMGGGVK